MWAVRETFVALITTNLPPIAPLLRRWMSPCFGRMDTSSDTTDARDGSSSRMSNMTRLGTSAGDRLSRKGSRAGHDQTMANRYFSGFGTASNEQIVMAQREDIKMQTYRTSLDDGRSVNNEWKAFHGWDASTKNEEDPTSTTPGLIIQKHPENPPAYGEADLSHKAQECRYIV